MRVLRLWAPPLLFALSLTPALAQTGVGVELDEVIDNRFSPGPMTGGLELRMKLKGTGLDKATAARIVVKDARDDKGNALAESGPPPDYTPRDMNMGTVSVSLKQTARAATKVRAAFQARGIL